MADLENLNFNFAAMRAFGGQNAAGERARLSSVSNVTVTREQVVEVAGGKEYFYDWQASDDRGYTTRFSTRSSRIDSIGSYTISMDFRIERFPLGMDEESMPQSSIENRVVVFGVKGEICGDVRQDRVIVTVFGPDGSSTQHEHSARVRLDLAEFARRDFASMATAIGEYMISKAR